MHSLLENDQITQLSLANNFKLTVHGFKYIAVYVKGVSYYKFLRIRNDDLIFFLYSLLN